MVFLLYQKQANNGIVINAKVIFKLYLTILILEEITMGIFLTRKNTLRCPKCGGYADKTDNFMKSINYMCIKFYIL